MSRITREELFWSKVEKTDTCWLWNGTICRNGYGRFIVRNNKIQRNYGAHRLSYAFKYGEISDKTLVLHKCDVRKCVNPDHLFLGNQKDNIRDMINKGRHFSPFKGKTHCKKGHEFSKENTSITKKGARICKSCQKIATKENLMKLKKNKKKYQNHLKIMSLHQIMLRERKKMFPL